MSYYDNVFLQPPEQYPDKEHTGNEKNEALESIFSDPSEFMEKFHYLTWKFDLSDMDLFIATALKMAYQRDYSPNATENLVHRLKQLEPVVDNSVDVLVEKELNLLPY